MAARASVLPKKQAPTKARKPTASVEDRIRQRAFEIYSQRGEQAGSEIDDWLQAEAEMTAAVDMK